MGEYGKPGLVHVNAANRWPHFKRRGLELAPDGTVRLFRLPRLMAPLPEAIEGGPVPAASSGVAVTPDGAVFYVGHDSGVVQKIDACSGRTAPVRCVSANEEAGALQGVRGLAVMAGGIVAVADAGHARIVLIDSRTERIVEVWRGITAHALAAGADGTLFVADRTTHRVRAFNRRGVEVWRAPDLGIDEPLALAVAGTRVYALGYSSGEAAWKTVSFEPGSSEPPASRPVDGIAQPMALAATRYTLFIGDNAARRVIAISLADDMLSGPAVGYRGPVAALALDGKGGLYVHAGGSEPPLRLQLDAGSVSSGVMWGPVQTGRGDPVQWHRARAFLSIPSQAHAQVYIAADQADVHADLPQPFGRGWTPKGLDVVDALIGGGKAARFWLGVHFFSDGTSTPALTQVQCTFDQPTYLSLLPPLYHEASPCGDFLVRYLSLLESFFAEGESAIDLMPALFDPDAATDRALPWLASWLAAEDDERWTDDKRREVIRAAFDWYGKRGTPEGMRQALRLFAGVRAVIDEPIQRAHWWGIPSVPDCTGDGDRSASILGAATALASAEPQGAIVGRSATLDRSHLLRVDEFARPLFDDEAYRFTVLLYRHEVATPEKLKRATEVIERERPAHTAFDICIVDAAMRIGQQSRIGIDSVVAGSGPPSRLGQSTEGFELAGEPSAPIGRGLRVGINTRA